MLTQIYTPQIRHIQSLRDKNLSKKPVDSEANADEQQLPVGSSTDQESSSKGGPSSALEEKEQQGRIAIGTILKDFKKTLEAIGAPNKVETDVMAYLSVVEHQSQQRQPSIGLIKQNLTIAAQTIDNYISHSLQRPSKVVKEWVDALLIQNIDFKSNVQNLQKKAKPDFDKYIQNDTSYQEKKTTETTNSIETKSENIGGFDLKNAFTNVENLLKQGQWFAAKSVLQGILQQEGLSEKAKAKSFFTLGQLAERDQNYPSALGYYQQASSAIESNLNSEASQQFAMRSYFKLGQTAQTLEQTDMALNAYQKALGYSQGNVKTLKQFEPYFKLLESTKQHHQIENTLRPYIDQQDQSPELANLYLMLANAQKAQKKHRSAFSTYQAGLQVANTSEDKQPLASALAQLYLENQQPEKALLVLKNNF